MCFHNNRYAIWVPFCLTFPPSPFPNRGQLTASHEPARGAQTFQHNVLFADTRFKSLPFGRKIPSDHTSALIWMRQESTGWGQGSWEKNIKGKTEKGMFLEFLYSSAAVEHGFNSDCHQGHMHSHKCRRMGDSSPSVSYSHWHTHTHTTFSF